MAAGKRSDDDKIFSFESDPGVRRPGGSDERETGGVPPAESEPFTLDLSGEVESATSAEIAKLQMEKEDLKQTLLRRQADFENFRKRIERERQEESRRGVERMVMDLVPVLDGFDRALQGHDDPAYEEYRKGMILIRKQLWDVLSRHGVQRVDAAGKIFDPNVHQAIERVESTKLPDGSIVDVFQDGYLFHGRVLRPAIVRVAVHPADAAASANEENQSDQA